ncbi:MAG TPA: GTPase HflX, partial [Firmicutes bacterium]|nr:GTPase HflX [Bacillota bacterium]
MDEKQRALLVGANINDRPDFQASMEELASLAGACELEVVGAVEQNLKEVNKAYYIGPGKAEELLAALEEANAGVVVFNNELSPSQLGNLEEKLGRVIMDRTALILEIFARRAKTRESRLQVEVARLQYVLPRLAGSYRSLSRQAGGVGTATRGAGEKKLELDRRKIEAKIARLKRELELIGKKRKIRRKKR